MRDAFFTDPWRSTLRVSAAFVVAFMLAFGLGTATQDAPAGATEECPPLRTMTAELNPESPHDSIIVRLAGVPLDQITDAQHYGDQALYMAGLHHDGAAHIVSLDLWETDGCGSMAILGGLESAKEYRVLFGRTGRYAIPYPAWDYSKQVLLTTEAPPASGPVPDLAAHDLTEAEAAAGDAFTVVHDTAHDALATDDHDIGDVAYQDPAPGGDVLHGTTITVGLYVAAMVDPPKAPDPGDDDEAETCEFDAQAVADARAEGAASRQAEVDEATARATTAEGLLTTERTNHKATEALLTAAEDDLSAEQDAHAADETALRAARQAADAANREKAAAESARDAAIARAEAAEAKLAAEPEVVNLDWKEAAQNWEDDARAAWGDLARARSANADLQAEVDRLSGLVTSLTNSIDTLNGTILDLQAQLDAMPEPERLPIPLNVQADDIGNRSAFVSWEPPADRADDVAGYVVVHRKLGPGTVQVPVSEVLPADARSWTHTNLARGKHSWRVYAVDDIGTVGHWSHYSGFKVR